MNGSGCNNPSKVLCYLPCDEAQGLSCHKCYFLNSESLGRCWDPTETGGANVKKGKMSHTVPWEDAGVGNGSNSSDCCTPVYHPQTEPPVGRTVGRETPPCADEE